MDQTRSGRCSFGRAWLGLRLRALLAALGPDLALLLAFGAVLGGLIAAYGGRLHFDEASILYPLGATGLLLAFSIGGTLWRRRPSQAERCLAPAPDAPLALGVPIGQLVRDWAPFILLVVVYENLRPYTALVRATPLDAELLAWDVRLFGGLPCLWAQRLVTPLLTDYMALAYGLYFPLPLILCLALYLRGRRADFRELTLAITTVMCAGFLLYVVFPAGPPRFFAPLAAAFSGVELRGRFGLHQWAQTAWDHANQIKVYASFPSLHCALSLLTLIYLIRFGGVFGRFRTAALALYGLLVPSLWLATLYLRHHWLVDNLAGWGLAVLAALYAPWLRRVWPAPGAAGPATSARRPGPTPSPSASSCPAAGPAAGRSSRGSRRSPHR